MRRIILSCIVAVGLALASCAPPPTANDIQRDQQSRITTEASKEVGMPNITHFREMRLMKAIYEMRDQDNLSSWTYVLNVMTGKFVLVCESIGFPIPYATQFSAPTTMQSYYVPNSGGSQNYYGVHDLPQSEPNGLHMPASADATFVMCIGPDKKPHPTYNEDKLNTFLYQLPDDRVQK